MDRNQIQKGAEAFYFPGNKTGVLVIHGFTGTTQSMYDYGESLAEAGYTVLGPRLTGHGTFPEQMEMASYLDWIKDVEAGLEKLMEMCDEIYIAGLSMGGTLALYLGERYPDLAGIILVNAAIELPKMTEYYEAKKDKSERFIPGIGSDIKKEDITELAYDKTPIKSMGDIIELMKLVKMNLTKITMPILIFSSNVDHVVPPENSRSIYNQVSSKQKKFIELKNSYHVATLDNDKDLIYSKTIEFLKSK
ncbi:MAG TPA: alpha/beta fold hydrolase [Pseudogracilibacillus sp.]|nr:alpha/beta fold hydrolase [Pseudogracilibacillus sp.]